MSLSVRWRMILAMNLLVIGVGVAVGWVGVQVAGLAVEHRMVDQSAANAAGLASQMWLPLGSADLMKKLGKILGAHTAAGPADLPAETPIVASSLPPDEATEFAKSLNRDPKLRTIRLAGSTYHVGSALAGSSPSQPVAAPMRMYVLVPDAQVAAAKGEAATTIGWLTAAAIVLATALAMWLSTTIARPIGKLATRMDALARQAEDAQAASLKTDSQCGTPALGCESRQSRDARPPIGATAEGGCATFDPHHPPEIARLERSFEQLLARLDDTRQQLARSARLATLGQIAASVAHELRNPLSGIKMNARVLADELKRANIADRSLDLIIREIDRMDLFLGELLDLASPGLADPLRAEPVQLSELAESVLSLLAGRCLHGGVEIIRQFADGQTRGDSQQLRGVMLNLMLNALDAMPHGGKLTVVIQPAVGDSGSVRFGVTDTGGGVQSPAGADIFDPFITTKPGGTGLGLAISRQVISRHSGRIGYDSSPTGSTFWFDLPNTTGTTDEHR